MFLSIGGAVGLIHSPLWDITKFEQLTPDFHYNAISMSATLGGFLFTGISVLISAIDKERIKRLWENNYLDNLYRSAFVGMFANIATIIVAFMLIFLNIQGKFVNILIDIEISSLIVGLVFFTWCIKHLICLIAKLK